MTRRTDMRRAIPPRAKVLALVAVGLCGLAVSATVTTGEDPPAPPRATAATRPPQGPAEGAEAPTGFDDPQVSNGFTTKDEFEEARETFMEEEDKKDGLGPVYNATSCVACHQ